MKAKYLRVTQCPEESQWKIRDYPVGNGQSSGANGDNEICRFSAESRVASSQGQGMGRFRAYPKTLFCKICSHNNFTKLPNFSHISESLPACPNGFGIGP